LADTSQTYTAYILTTPERLGRALTDPADTARYFDFVEGLMRVESDWWTGSPVQYRAPDGQVQLTGEVVHAEPPHMLVVTFSALYDADVQRDAPSRIRWEVAQLDKVCSLTPTQDRFDLDGRTARDFAACAPTILSNLKMWLETGRRRLFEEIVVDCESPQRLAEFWAAVTGFVRVAETDGYSALADPRGVEPELAFQRVAEVKTVKNRVHLDLQVENLDREVERLLSVGAVRAEGYPQTMGAVVLRDPEGNEFCVLG